MAADAAAQAIAPCPPARLPGPGSLWVLAGLTSPWQCGQVSIGFGRANMPDALDLLEANLTGGE